MINQEFIRFLDNGYKGIGQVRKNFPNELRMIEEFNQSYGDISWGQKLYNYINNITSLPKCKCGANLKFYKYGRGYARYCSVKCKINDDELKKDIKKTFIEKYGVENPLQSPEIQEKRKKMFFNKYGVEHQSQLSEVKEKKRKTNLEKYGVTTNLLHVDTIKKSKITNLEKYGVEHNSQSEIIKEKKRKTNLEKYGVEHVFQSKKFRDNLKINIDNKYLLKISKMLNHNINNFEIDGENIIVKNYCEKHNSFKISKHNFYSRFVSYKQKNFCTECFPVAENNSIKEKEFKNFIKSLNFRVIENNRKIISPKEIDVYLPQNKLAIEFNGLYWHSVKHKEKRFHLNKTEECEKHGIQLLHVFEDEWIYKQEIVKSIIKSKLGIVENKIYARKTEVREISDNKLVRDFLNNNHIQGFVGSKIKIGLFYNDELISLMTFGKKRVAMGNKQQIDGEYEMLRFCNKLNNVIIGGASKILKYFINTYKPKSILSFADRRYSNGKLYKQLGFRYVGNTRPNYWYFNQNELVRHHRFGFRKDVLVKEGFSSNMTESQIMEERGYLSIYDCGNMKFKMNL